MSDEFRITDEDYKDGSPAHPDTPTGRYISAIHELEKALPAFNDQDQRESDLAALQAALDVSNRIQGLELGNDRGTDAFHLLITMVQRGAELGFDFDQVLEEVRTTIAEVNYTAGPVGGR